MPASRQNKRQRLLTDGDLRIDMQTLLSSRITVEPGSEPSSAPPVVRQAARQPPTADSSGAPGPPPPPFSYPATLGLGCAPGTPGCRCCLMLPDREPGSAAPTGLESVPILPHALVAGLGSRNHGPTQRALRHTTPNRPVQPSRHLAAVNCPASHFRLVNRQAK